MKKRAFSSPGKSGSPGGGVGFFQQFTRHFIRPYGEAEGAPSPETVLKRLKPYSCEWLLRPKVALSELSDTVTKNMRIMTKKDQKVFTPETVNKFVSEMSELNKPLKKLHKDAVTSACEKDVVDVLKFLFQDHEDLDIIVDEMFHVGGAMFATAVQLIVARTLVQDPERYAELVEASETGSDAVFKKNADIESMRDFIVSSVLGRKHERGKQPARKDLLKQFDSPTKRANVKASSHTSESSSDDEEEIPKRSIIDSRAKSKPKRIR